MYKRQILNNASAAGLRGLPNGVAYSASKHAVVGMTKTAAMEYAKFGIRINALCPSFTETEMFSPELFDKISEGISEKLRRCHIFLFSSFGYIAQNYHDRPSDSRVLSRIY